MQTISFPSIQSMNKNCAVRTANITLNKIRKMFHRIPFLVNSIVKTMLLYYFTMVFFFFAIDVKYKSQVADYVIIILPDSLTVILLK